MSNAVKEKSPVEKFLASLEGTAGITKERGGWEYVDPSLDNRTPCMYDDAVIQEALASGKAVNRELRIHSTGKPMQTIPIVGLPDAKPSKPSRG